MLWNIQFVAKVVVFLAYILQQAILDFAIAAARIFIGFLLGMVGVISLRG